VEKRCNAWAERNGFTTRYPVVDSRHMTKEELAIEIKIAKEIGENMKI
jgi:hypothetical protein